jgi:hypothetical protein
MDDEGEYILGTYLYGGGKPVTIFDVPMWTTYMKQNEGLRRQIFGRLILVVKDILITVPRHIKAGKKKDRYPISDTFHAECPENSGFSGYALLHGTNKTVGDFRLTGWADVQDAVDPADGVFLISISISGSRSTTSSTRTRTTGWIRFAVSLPLYLPRVGPRVIASR